MNSLFQNNLAHLQNHLGQAPEIPEVFPATLRSASSPSGDVTIRYQETSVHSQYDPVKEAQTFARDVQPDDLVCLYGYGLGYHLESILDKMNAQGFLMVIELNPDILAGAMHLRDQSRVLTDPRVQVICGTRENEIARSISEGMRRMQQKGGEERLKIKLHPPSLQCIPAQFKNLVNALEILLLERRTPAIFGALEEENLHHNRDAIRVAKGIRDYRDRHRNRPGLLVSAGPSLDDALPYLGYCAKDAIVGCVDTAFPILLHNGLTPDYVFTLDPQEASFKHFEAHLDRSVPLIFLSTANARIIRNYSGPKIVAFKECAETGEPNPKGTTKAGGSVSCLGLDGLIQMGCDPILLLGQDCAFSGNRTYSRKALSEIALMDKLNASSTLAALHQELRELSKNVEVPLQRGGSGTTNQMMYSYLRNLQELAEANPSTRIFNVLAHGAAMDPIASLGSVQEVWSLLQTKPETGASCPT